MTKNKEEGVKYDNESNDSDKKSDEQLDVRTGENDKDENTEQKKELEEYSDGVKRRIAKLN